MYPDETQIHPLRIRRTHLFGSYPKRFLFFLNIRASPCLSVAIKSILLLGIVFLSGCATTPDSTRMNLDAAGQLAASQSSSDHLRPFYQRLNMEGESNATLNRMRLVSAAMECGEWKTAEQTLDQIIPDIEALGPADPRSREALSQFSSEDIKRFKGEAYERAMIYFSRGILYMQNEDWSNARACFKSVQLQDVSEDNPGQDLACDDRSRKCCTEPPANKVY